MASPVPTIRLLQCEADPDDISYFRILIDHKFTRYLSIDRGIWDIDDLCFAPVFVTLLPPLPAGDWNEGHISLDPTSGKPHFSSLTKTALPAVKSTWHPRDIDYLELCMQEGLRSNVYEASSPCVSSGETVIAKFARFSWEVAYLDAETRAYEWIEGHGIGPKFLGHLSEQGRVIGFVLEHIQDARRAGPDDLALCQEALLKLHRLGIKHGDVNRYNFLIRAASAILVDFECTVRCTDQKVLDEEFATLEDELRDESGNGGMLTEVSSV